MSDINRPRPPLRRRFALTFAALGIGALALPLYAMVQTMSDAAPADQPNAVESEVPRPELVASSRPLADAKTEAPPDDWSPEPAMAVATGSESAPPPRAEIPKSGMYAMSGKKKAKEAVRDEAGGGEVHRGEEGRMGRDDRREDNQRPAIGQLTAGIVDDVTRRDSLDELRTRLGHDTDLLQAIPDHGAAAPLPGPHAAPPALQIALLMDTTGSMGDELAYLQAELRSIALSIGHEFPGVEQEFALVAYKDQGDAYVVRAGGFASIDTFLGDLEREHADGGGDTPEAMDAAMQVAGQLSWSNDAARLVLLVADAPPHPEGYRDYVRATAKLTDAGVSVYPVASSGIDTPCEYLMRWAARTTGGKYLFLTDHSGMGNPHAVAHVDSYELKSLRTHLLQVIRSEMGAGIEVPEAWCGTVALEARERPWHERHAPLLWVLGGTFLLGFSLDMTRAWFRRRRSELTPPTA